MWRSQFVVAVEQHQREAGKSSNNVKDLKDGKKCLYKIRMMEVQNKFFRTIKWFKGHTRGKYVFNIKQKQNIIFMIFMKRVTLASNYTLFHISQSCALIR